MTARCGSSGGDLGDARNATDAAEDAAEAGDAGQGADEPRLRAMRAVWLAMRDEAPPDRGLAELLAAARREAEDMAAAMQPTPTLWQRLLAALRRPPVLALATALVMIGGAVIIGRRVGDPKSRPESVAGEQVDGSQAVTGKLGRGASTTPAGAGSAVGPPTTATARGEPPSATPGGLSSPAAGAPVEPGELQHAAVRDARPAAAVQSNRPAREAVARPAPPWTEASAGRRPAAPTVAPAPVAPSTPRSKDGVAGALEADESAGRDIREKDTARVTLLRGSPSPPPHARPRAAGSVEPPEDEAPPPVADNHGAGDGTREGTDDTKVAHPQGQPARGTLAQLYQQCESAASRRDCAAVRRIVDQITRTDRGYRDRIAEDSPVAKCLAE